MITKFIQLFFIILLLGIGRIFFFNFTMYLLYCMYNSECTCTSFFKFNRVLDWLASSWYSTTSLYRRGRLERKSLTRLPNVSLPINNYLAEVQSAKHLYQYNKPPPPLLRSHLALRSLFSASYFSIYFALIYIRKPKKVS